MEEAPEAVVPHIVEAWELSRQRPTRDFCVALLAHPYPLTTTTVIHDAIQPPNHAGKYLLYILKVFLMFFSLFGQVWCSRGAG
jgi:hypothetical protein